MTSRRFFNRNRHGVSVAFAAVALALAVGIAGPIAMLRAADELAGAPLRRQGSRKPKDGAKLQPGMEEKLRWGEPGNGLRAALIIRLAPGEPKAGNTPDLYLVVQNVSDAPIRLSDRTAAPKLRDLKIKDDGVTQLGIVAKEPTLADVMLQPREVAFLLMLPPDSKSPGGRTTGSLIAEGTLKDAHQTLVAEMMIEHAPAGAWSGKLVTGETSGAVAAGKPQPKDQEPVDDGKKS